VLTALTFICTLVSIYLVGVAIEAGDAISAAVFSFITGVNVCLLSADVFDER
jgi:hypothetical protein